MKLVKPPKGWNNHPNLLRKTWFTNETGSIVIDIQISYKQEVQVWLLTEGWISYSIEEYNDIKLMIDEIL